VTDKNNSIACAFTGDTLFLGDVGRPDLAVTTQLTEKDLAGMMYDSLQNKILKLPDECVIFPGHGIGSACGKNISSGLCDTLHNQKQTNYALQPITKEEFITVLTTNIPKAPGYFPQAAKLNKSGYMLLSDVIEKNSVLLPADKFKQKIDEGILVIDTRSVKDFIQGFIPGSISISLEMNFSPWVGKLINHEVPILLVCDPHREKEAVMRLARIGYENIQGILDGGCAAWVNKGYQTNKGYSIEVSALKNIMEKE
jgi:hydroxyacylglutathione hydrolase